MPFLRRPPSRRPTSTKVCVWGCIRDIFLGFKFRQDRLKNVGAVGVEISAFPLTGHIAYTTACCYRTSRDYTTFARHSSERCQTVCWNVFRNIYDGTTTTTTLSTFASWYSVWHGACYKI